MNLRKFFASLMTMTMVLTMVGSASADGGASAGPIWLTATNKQGQTRVTHYFIVPGPNDNTLYGSGQIFIDFGPEIDITDVSAATSVLVDWGNNNDQNNPTATTGTITKAGGAGGTITIPFTLPNVADNYQRTAVVEIRELTNPAETDPMTADINSTTAINWRHGNASNHTNANNVSKVFEPEDNQQHEVTVAKKMRYDFNGDATLTYAIAPEEGIDTNNVRFQIQTNADTYDLRLYREGTNWTVSAIDAAGQAGGAATPEAGGLTSLPLDGAAAGAWGGGDFTNSANANAFDPNEKGFGVNIDQNGPNDVNVSGPDAASLNDYFDLAENSSVANADIMSRDADANQWTGRNSTDDVDVTFGARANYTTQAGKYTLQVTFNLIPTY